MTPHTKASETTKSTLTFGALAAYFFVFGVLYLVWPMAPYHQEIIGTSASELASSQPAMYALVTGLVDVAGASFLAVAIAVFAFGRDAGERPTATLALVGLLAAYTFPLTYVVYLVDGPIVLGSIPLVIHLIGLGIVYAEKEWTLEPHWPVSAGR